MVNILLGEYGCGKSTEIYNRIEKDYQNDVSSFLIVPEQFALECEKRIASFSPKAQLYCEVLNFSRLTNRFFREHGGLRYNYITESTRNLIMYIAVSNVMDRFESYKVSKGHEKNCVSLFLQAIFELKSYNKTPKDLEKLIVLVKNEALQNKLSDLSLVWAEYERLMRDKFSDPLNDIYNMTDMLKDISYFKGYNVYIDSFYSFTKGQLDIISYIIRDANEVTFAFDCAQLNSSKMEYDKVKKCVYGIIKLCNKHNKDYEISYFENDYLHKDSPDLSHICKNLWDFSSEPINSYENVDLVLCGDEFDESELVASRIRQLVEEKDYKYGDICVIARNSDTYRGILDYTLKKYQIPYFFSSPTDLLSMPVIKMVFNSLNAINGYKAEDIISYAKCGYSDLDIMSISMLDEYMTRWGIYGKRFLNDDYWNGSPDGYVTDKKEEYIDRLTVILNARHSIISKFKILEKPFLADGTVRDCAVSVFDFLKAHDIIDKLENEKKSADKEGAYLIAQVYNALLKALDTIVDVCGDTKVTPSSFSTLLLYALMDSEINTIPTGEDNVLIADASLVRATSIKHVFLIGVNEGVFPASVNESSFFTDNDKYLIENADSDFILSDNTDIRSTDELLFFKNSIAIASSGVTISSLNSSIMGENKKPSIGYTRIKALIKNVKENYSSKNPIDKIYTEELAREYYTIADDDLKKAISKNMEISVSKANFSNDELVLSEDTLNGIYKDELRLTQSAIEKFQTCHLSYYANRFLKLRDFSRFQFSSLHVGNMFHFVFESILTHLNNVKNGYEDITDEQVKELVTSFLDTYIKSVCNGAYMSGELTHLFTRMETNLQVLTKKIVDEFRQSGFKPAYFELNFDGDGIENPLPLKLDLKNGSTVILHGKADRVDVYRDENTTYVRIVDYKTGNKTFKMADFENGTELQLFIYLFALCEMEDCKFKKSLLESTNEIRPAGAYYMPLKVGKTIVEADLLEDVNESMKSSINAVKKNAIPNGRFLKDDAICKIQDKSGEYFPAKKNSSSYLDNDEFFALFDQMKDILNDVVCSMKNGDASAIPLKDDAFFSSCDYCSNKAFCRRRK